MCASYSYATPDPDEYLQAVVEELRFAGKDTLVYLLRGAYCNMTTGLYSENRWDCLYTTVYLSVPRSRRTEFSDDVIQELLPYFDKAMPSYLGLDVMEIVVETALRKNTTEKSLIDDLEEICTNCNYNTNIYFPADLHERGKETAEVYLYLYCVENTLRLFIEKVAKDTYGEDYLKSLKINQPIANKIKNRKEQESIKAILISFTSI